VEAAAVTVLYAFIIECLIFRDLSITKDLPGVAVESATLVGGFMIILAVALGFTSFLILAQLPMHALAWVQAHIDSPIVFLLALNLLLIVVGALMDIYSAILVIVPLITPMAVAYGIDPVHLGIIMVVNLEIGMVTPPIGLNLFVTAGITGMSIMAVARAALPWTLVLLAFLAMITYLPAITLVLPNLLF
jgi:tripartite ATP-independent transporter DctM subunit